MIMPLLALSFLWKFIAVVWVVVSITLVLLILVQKGRGSGLGGAFGAGGSMGSLLGTKTGDFLTWLTIILVAVFLILAILMGIMGANEIKQPQIIDQPIQSAPIETPAVPADAPEVNIPAANDVVPTTQN